MFTPQERVLRQPVAESLTCAEVQRIVSMFLSINNWIRGDRVDEAYIARRCLKLVIESIESNHIAKKIFNYCFSEGDIQRFDPLSLDILVPLLDDFEAFFFNDMANIIRNNLELFGFTEDVVLDPRLVDIPHGAAYENARESGIIAVNDARGNVEVIHIGRAELNNYLSNKSLRTRIHELRRDGIVATLPIYIAYREEQGYIWSKESEAFEIRVPRGERIYGTDESLVTGTFLRQYLLPADRGPAFPDQYFIGSPFLSFWYSGDVSLTFTAHPVDIVGRWLTNVESWKGYVVFDSPLRVGNPTSEVQGGSAVVQ